MTISDVPTIHEMGRNEIGFRVSESEFACFWSAEQLQHWIQYGEDVLLVAEVDGKIVGFVLTALHRPTGKVTWENQMVLSEYRGQGVAKALMKEMKVQLKQKGATYLHFLVKTNNKASEFYEKIGFEKGHGFTWFGMNL